MTPLFSICHTTARPDKWRASYDAWISRAASPQQVEYVLCCDERWGFRKEDGDGQFGFLVQRPSCRYTSLNCVVWDEGHSPVSGWNTAAAASTGNILILNSDDMRPPRGWDDLLSEQADRVAISYAWYDSREFVIHVSSGTAADQKKIWLPSSIIPVSFDGLMVLPILSRARYKRLGYALWPEYPSGMYADDDFTAHAYWDGCVIDARHLRFQHYHPAFGTAEDDDVYRRENRKEAYDQGKEILERRRKSGFGDEIPVAVGDIAAT